jgi:hypothetical protein
MGRVAVRGKVYHLIGWTCLAFLVAMITAANAVTFEAKVVNVSDG